MATHLEKSIIEARQLPQIPSQEWTLEKFLGYIEERSLQLYPAQEEAILEIMEGKNLILNTPTGSGKSLVALALHFDALIKGQRSFYTSPIKALVNEKFFDLCRAFGPDQVGMITGDASVNSEAPVICCTAEILSNMALREGSQAPVHAVVMDEFHYYSDRDRGVAWQVPLLTLPQTRFVLMSATMGKTEPFSLALTHLNGLPTALVQSKERPVPLEFHYSEIPLHEQVQELIQKGRAPIYLVSFTQKECAESAQDFMSLDLCTKLEKQRIDEEIVGFRFSSPYGKEIKKFLKHGIGLHHAGLLPKYRILVERLAQKGLLKIIFGTDTLGVGVNVPLKTVLFSKLCKFDGRKASILTVRDFHQIAGRAGRKGFDDLGTVVAQAPEHIIENQRNEAKALGDPKKLKKLVKKKPPEWGYVPWSRETFERLIQSESEALSSQFSVSHAMLLNVLSRPNEDGCRAMQKLIRSSHETKAHKKAHVKKSFELFRSLIDRDIIKLNPLRINIDLQEDFSLNHALSLFLIDSLHLLDSTADIYPLEVLTLTESILESPDLILRRQLDRIKREKLRELKEMGVEYDERMEELEKLEHPKPMRDFIYDTFNHFARLHPWLGEENIRPKCIAREIYEGFYSFGDYIKEYDLQRAEGVLLRYLSEVYKALTQNVPDFAKTDEVFEMTLYFGEIIRQIDSSLIDEWEKLKLPGDQKPPLSASDDSEKSLSPPSSYSLIKDEKRFPLLIKNETFRFLKTILGQDKGDLAPFLSISSPSTSAETEALIEKQLNSFFEEFGSRPQCTPEARRKDFFKIIKEPLAGTSENMWLAQQILLDENGATDWHLVLMVDLAQSKLENIPILKFMELGPMTLLE